MAAGRSAGREQLLDAAERLMVERGINGVSLREISAQAGHRNVGATQYHFGDREGLVRGILVRHMDAIGQERQVLMDKTFAENPEPTLRTLIWLVIRPMVNRLDTPSGRRYLQVVHQLLDLDEYRPMVLSVMGENVTLQRCFGQLLAELMKNPPSPPRILAERRIAVFSFILRAMADQARRIDAESPDAAPLDRELFTANLVDVIEALMTTPASAETLALLPE
jgi:AcrR family transcriptional regulator